jgi:hypothetical protein
MSCSSAYGSRGGAPFGALAAALACWPTIKAVIDRIVRDCIELAAHGIGSIAIMSNDPTDYPEDSFDNMVRVAREKRFPFPYVQDETPQVAKAYGAQCNARFLRLQRQAGASVPRAHRCLGPSGGAQRAPRALRRHGRGGEDRPRPPRSSRRPSAARSSGDPRPNLSRPARAALGAGRRFPPRLILSASGNVAVISSSPSTGIPQMRRGF